MLSAEEKKEDPKVTLAKLRKLPELEVIGAKKHPIFKVPAPVSPPSKFPGLRVTRIDYVPVTKPLRSPTKVHRVWSSMITTFASPSQSMTLATSPIGAKISPTKRLRITPTTSPAGTPNKRSRRDSTTRSPGDSTARSPRSRARSSRPLKTSSKDLSQQLLGQETQADYELEYFLPSNEYTAPPGETIIYECPFCYTPCTSEGETNNHLLFQCREIDRFHCPYCEEKKKSQAEAFFHVDVMHPEKERCIFDWLDAGYLKKPMAELEWKEGESDTDL